MSKHDMGSCSKHQASVLILNLQNKFKDVISSTGVSVGVENKMTKTLARIAQQLILCNCMVSLLSHSCKASKKKKRYYLQTPIKMTERFTCYVPISRSL